MRKVMSVLMFGTVLFLLMACGGGGGGSPEATGPPEGQITCPDGSKVPLASGAGACPAVELLAVPPSYANAEPRALAQGIIVQFTGALDPESVTGDTVTKKGTVVLWEGDVNTGRDTPGSTWLAGNMDLTFAPVQRLAYGQTYNLAIDVDDSVGRSVSFNVPITTMPMSCTNSAVWSTPATFSTAYNNCIAGIGIQTQITPMNTLQDGTCAITIGTPLTEACKAYFANGTMVLTSTGIMVNGHSTIWMTYIGMDAPRKIVLLEMDPYDPLSLTPVATSTLLDQLTWIIGNPSGAFIHTADGKGSQLTVDSSSQIVSTCVLNCQ